MKSIDCEYFLHIVPYLNGDLSEVERDQLEQHLKNCASCREELAELTIVWESIPYEMDEVEPPADLKHEVFSSIFSTQTNSSVKDKKSVIANMWRARFKPYMSSRSVKVAAVLFLLLVGMGWNNVQLRTQLSTIEKEGSFPAQIAQTYTLTAADPDGQPAYGNAWLIVHGEQKRLVVHMNGLSSTTGEEAYQVWLIHDGKRNNAGTFRVDSVGHGVLTYMFTDPDMEFDAIGITLEPDPYGEQPRGKKVSGTT
jgi:anti-sigma factor RsiW